jgi:hypothetical protein
VVKPLLILPFLVVVWSSSFFRGGGGCHYIGGAKGVSIGSVNYPKQLYIQYLCALQLLWSRTE